MAREINPKHRSSLFCDLLGSRHARVRFSLEFLIVLWREFAMMISLKVSCGAGTQCTRFSCSAKCTWKRSLKLCLMTRSWSLVTRLIFFCLDVIPAKHVLWSDNNSSALHWEAPSLCMSNCFVCTVPPPSLSSSPALHAYRNCNWFLTATEE